MDSFICPLCANQISVPDAKEGEIVRCPFCLGEIQIPAPQPGSAPPQTPPSSPSMQLAVMSLLFGILSYFLCLGPLLGIPAIILGHKARAKAKQDPGPASGSGVALAGLILGYLNVAITALVVLAAAVISVLAWMEPEVAPAASSARRVERPHSLPAEAGGDSAGSRQTVQADPGPAVDAEEAGRRASCVGNLKALGLCFRSYCGSSRGEKFPELSSEPGCLMFTNSSRQLPPVYPGFLQDTGVLTCPGTPGQTGATAEGSGIAFDDRSYFYLGYTVTSDEEMQAFADAYRRRIEEGLSFDDDLDVAPDRGVAGGSILYRLREGIERFLISDINDPGALGAAQSKLPVLIERPGHHTPAGGHVLFSDGHVEFIPYPGKWPMTEKTMGIIESLDSMPGNR